MMEIALAKIVMASLEGLLDANVRI